MRDIKDALESMVWQFGYHGVKNGKPTLWTGGLSALEGAFEALGWDDPHYILEEGNTCEVVGCMQGIAAGMPWSDAKGEPYLHLCSEHHMESHAGKPRPPIKQYALDREATRDPVTRMLPGKVGKGVH